MNVRKFFDNPVTLFPISNFKFRKTTKNPTKRAMKNLTRNQTRNPTKKKLKRKRKKSQNKNWQLLLGSIWPPISLTTLPTG